MFPKGLPRYAMSPQSCECRNVACFFVAPCLCVCGHVSPLVSRHRHLFVCGSRKKMTGDGEKNRGGKRTGIVNEPLCVCVLDQARSDCPRRAAAL